MVRFLGCMFSVCLFGCGVDVDDETPALLEDTSAVQGALGAGSLQFGAAGRLAGGGSFVHVCSSGGTSCTLVEINAPGAGPRGYSLQKRCYYGQGCRSVPQYRGTTVERCRYGEGCHAVPAFLPRAQERCFYGSGCELFPVFAP
jgi:hypothetical protein